jgi:hypothetical protein
VEPTSRLNDFLRDPPRVLTHPLTWCTGSRVSSFAVKAERMSSAVSERPPLEQKCAKQKRRIFFFAPRVATFATTTILSPTRSRSQTIISPFRKFQLSFLFRPSTLVLYTLTDHRQCRRQRRISTTSRSIMGAPHTRLQDGERRRSPRKIAEDRDCCVHDTTAFHIRR